MRRWLIPSLPEVLFLAIFIWLFAGASGWSGLLADGDTGWHIRNGQLILQHHAAPREDWFGFGAEGHPWFAWEWLADIAFALLHRAAGLKAVVFASGIVIACSQYIVFRHCLWRGVNPLAALAATLAATNASTVHYLARPHVFTLLFTAAAAWLLDIDRAKAARIVWTLPLLVALWTNLHGGFLAVFVLLGARMLECICVRAQRAELGRMAWLSSLCAAATFLNPYGWRLHVHLWQYLGSNWIRDSIEEFQSPRFRSESMFWFELLLALGIAALPRLIARMRIRDAALIVFWGHAALVSVRHVPVYAIVAIPPIAAEIDAWWQRATITAGRRSLLRAIRELGQEWRKWTTGFTIVPAVCLIAMFLIPPASFWPADFPHHRFPAAMVSRNAAAFSAVNHGPARVFSTDQWSDYLIYRLHPNIRTYFDGRSDFFAEWRGEDYRALMEGRPGSIAILDRDRTQFALVPAGWPLAGLMMRDPEWKQIDHDSMALLFVRR